MSSTWSPTENCENCGHTIEILKDDYIELSVHSTQKDHIFCEKKCLREFINSPDF